MTAIVALGPAIEASEDETSYAVGCITVFGLLALFAYPWLAHALFGSSPLFAGIFLGTSIHDTSQVTGASLIYQEAYDAPSAWQSFLNGAGIVSAWALAAALVGIGLTTDLRKLRALGWRPLAVGLAAALSVGFVSAGILSALATRLP